MSVRPSLACVREVSVSTATAPSGVSVQRVKCETPSPMLARTATNVRTKIPASTVDVLTLTAATTAAATLATSPVRTARAA